MAQKRMIDKKISVSEDVASLKTSGQLLFTWMIPHSDDVGLLPFTARSIKALVVPMNDDFNVETIGNHLEDMVKAGLLEVFEWEKDLFFRIINFHQHQTLKYDRKPQCIAKNITSWKTVDSIWKTLEDKGAEVTEERKEKNWQDFKKIYKIKSP